MGNAETTPIEKSSEDKNQSNEEEKQIFYEKLKKANSKEIQKLKRENTIHLENEEILFKPKKKKFIKNDFKNLDDYITKGDKDLLIKDLESYENNIREEENKISELYPNLLIDNSEKQVKDEHLKKNKKEFGKNLLLITFYKKYLDELEIFDTSSKEFYTDLALTCKKYDKKAYLFYEQMSKDY